MRGLGAIAILAVLVVFPVSASAQSLRDGLYLEGRGGVSFTSDIDNSGQGIVIEAEVDPGFAGEGAVGYAHDSGFRGEIALGYRQSGVDDLTIQNDGGFGAALGVGSLNGVSLGSLGVGVDGDGSLLNVMVNGYYDFDLGSKLTPFIGAGVGWGHVSLDIDLDSGGQTVSVVDDSDNVFAYQGIIGLSYEFTDGVSALASYSYLATSDPEFEDSSGVPFDSEYSSHNILVGVRFKL